MSFNLNSFQVNGKVCLDFCGISQSEAHKNYFMKLNFSFLISLYRTSHAWFCNRWMERILFERRHFFPRLRTIFTFPTSFSVLIVYALDFFCFPLSLFPSHSLSEKDLIMLQMNVLHLCHGTERAAQIASPLFPVLSIF